MKVLTLVDHLKHGGVQRMALFIANTLPDFGVESHLCTIKDCGDLRTLISKDIKHYTLSASSMYSPLGAIKLLRYCQSHHINIVHIHHRALYLAFMSFLFSRNFITVWHDHYGRQNTRTRPWFVYYPLTRIISGVISVSHPLMNWAIRSMRIPPDKVRFIPNFIEPPEVAPPPGSIELPGESGYRVVCVANFRPHKDHITLLQGFKEVVEKCPQAHLILVGDVEDENYYQKVERDIDRLSLSKHVTNLGKRMDVYNILAGADVGILSSTSEGLPVTLIEYGFMSLPVVCTNVGDCQWLIKHNERGLLIPPSSSGELASALLQLLNDNLAAKNFGDHLNKFVEEKLSKQVVVKEIVDYYKYLSNYREIL
jgi:glycosyltransferase involved in cell wall biosynthesis